MIAMTIASIAEIVSGRLTPMTDPHQLVTGPIEFDSRKITQGGLFVALIGERSDGHDFITQACDAGAVAALVSQEVNAAAVVVDDVLVALGKLARAVVDNLPELTIIGVTGSSGKTSTKDLMAQVVARLGKVIAPPGSFNNELGHPYTVLQADQETRYLILEKSSRGPGHITWLTTVAPPRIGVVLNVGAAHVGEFGSLEITQRAKAELVKALPAADQGGVAILNYDDPRVAAMANQTPARVVWFGQNTQAAFHATDISLDAMGRPSFTLQTPDGSVPVQLGLYGLHHVSNALAAAALANELGMEVTAIGAALSESRILSPGRMQIHHRFDGVTIIDDAYNANPDSMRAGLQALTTIQAKRRWAVLGHMAELGEHSESEHFGIGRYVAELGIDRLVVIGPMAEAMHRGARDKTDTPGLTTSSEEDFVHVRDADAALRLLTAELEAGDVVLVKASKAAQLGQIIAGLLPEGHSVGVDGKGAPA